MSEFALIVPENFIQATRDSGYKSLGSALAELIDNAFEAKANHVRIAIEKSSYGDSPDVRVTVADDGIGMNRITLRHALQFGWSSRFNQRDGHGRYGMGLPNASLSHARRVEVVSSDDSKLASRVYLDVDEVIKRHDYVISLPETFSWPPPLEFSPFPKGTVVVWHKCDRLLDRKLGPLARKLRAELGRLFRYQLWAKKTIEVNGEAVVPFDPLFMRKGANLIGAEPHGPELLYPVTVSAGQPRKRTSTIRVRFTRLPISKWHAYSNQEKNAQGIAKNAGVTIVRAGREIDRGWFFMGQKRKENYDDWWRCEIRFEPELDEWFGVTHTKQEIHPTDQLIAILSPELEKIARDLNGFARRSFISVKEDMCRRNSEKQAERFDNLIEPPNSERSPIREFNGRVLPRGRGRIAGLQYRLKFGQIVGDGLYHVHLEGSRLTVTMNERHPFVRAVWTSEANPISGSEDDKRNIELLILALARAQSTLSLKSRITPLADIFHHTWSNILATFLN